MNLENAILLDRRGDLNGASLAYESVLKQEPGQHIALVNLIVLYWQATDFGFSSSNGLTPEFVRRAGARLRDLLDQNKQNQLKADYSFWKKYIAWADLGDNFELEECRRLLRIEPDHLEPAMFIFSASDGLECKEMAEVLLARCMKEGTIRAKYVGSVIQGAMQRHDLKGSATTLSSAK